MHAAAERAIHYACSQFNVGQFQSQRIDVQFTTKDKMQVCREPSFGNTRVSSSFNCALPRSSGAMTSSESAA